jgi:cyclophilin family peptidyl-prolyl cis-trans isomerase
MPTPSLLAALLSFFMLAAGQTQTAPAGGPQSGQAPPAQKKEEVAVISTDVGGIVIRFFPDSAPQHVANFKELARSKFYDGTTFHRVVRGFVIQGGDPLSKDADPSNDGTGDGPRRLPAEFNQRPHVRGALSMARSSDPNSASCQFFIVLADSPNTRYALDGKYSLFGQVIDGMDAVDRIAAQPATPGGDRPMKPVVMRSVRIETRSVPE